MMPQYVFALVCRNKQKARQHVKYTDVGTEIIHIKLKDYIVSLYDDWLRDVTIIFSLNANLQNVTSADLYVKVTLEAFICLEKTW